MSSRRRISTSAPKRWRSRPVSQSFGRLTIQGGNAPARFPNVASILSVCSSDKFPSRSVRETPARSVTASDIRIPTPGMAVSEIATARVPSRSVFAMRTMYRKSSFPPSSFLGPRGALGSSFSSSFFFPPRSALSGFAGTGGPSGSGLGFSSGIDEIPGWDGHPNFRTYLRIRSARPEARVLEDEASIVYQDFDRISGVEVFESVSSFRDPGVTLGVRSPADRGAAIGPSVAIRHRLSGLRELQRLAHRDRILFVSREPVERLGLRVLLARQHDQVR